MKTLVDIARRRLANQHLVGAPFSTPEEVVNTLGAVQAQDYPGAKWAVAQRMKGISDSALDEALARGTVLRTHVLRPTWHFVTPADIRWMLALTAPRIAAAMGYYNRKLELDEDVFRRSNRAIARALAGGKQLTRSELAAVLRRAGIGTITPQRLGHLVMQAELDTVICSGARRGKQFTYALLDERAPAARPFRRDEALHRLATIYFRTRGPATAHDFAWWSGLTIADARRGVQLAASELEEETIADRKYWFGASETNHPKSKRAAHLLPNYDEYFIGLKDRSAIGVRLKESRVDAPAQTFFAHLVTIDGQLVGGWKRKFERDRVIVDLDLVVPLSAPERRAIAAAARKYGAFLGLPVEIGD